MLPAVCSFFIFSCLETLTNSFRLSDNARAREALRQCLPEPLRDATFSSVLRDDAATKRCLAQLLINLSDNVEAANNQQLMH
jgi:CCR4-NOT transcription complex subunit 9